MDNEDFMLNDIFNSAMAKCRPGCTLCEGPGGHDEEESEEMELTEQEE